MKGKTGKHKLNVPDFFMKVLKKNKKTRQVFEKFSFTNKREYVEWVAEAKTEETRRRRLETSLDWISQGKIRHWEYVKS